MKISIVIPAYNEEKAIESVIDACLKQTYPDFEIIVVDNASTDKTSELAQKKKVKVVLENRKGLLWAREAGRKVATGQIIANLDADCLPDPDWLQKGAMHFSDEKISATTGPYDYYDGSKFFRSFSLFTQKNLYSLISIILQKINYFHILWISFYFESQL